MQEHQSYIALDGNCLYRITGVNSITITLNVRMYINSEK